MSPDLPDGVVLIPLAPHRDHRGSLTEVFRRGWETPGAPAQWNLTTSETGVLRGIHVHLDHSDYVVVATGRADIGLSDIRRGSPTEGLATVVPLSEDEPAGLVIPPGVLHGFHFHERSILLYGLSEEWDPEDDIACRWDDPDAAIPWQVDDPLLSDRDAEARPLREILPLIDPAEPIGGPAHTR
ncbi:MAG TPA: dTDP-4-dehydrorhamnose 3,5-epimerase family protein [Actinomycetota bacterium]|nr:dTDP-4-dehydrorhamnose 3,5-epimerase family protein [Actinomycetota bacterium]